ncbi:uncharacterized protein ACRADG_009033 isoform 2-T2 [Cochliomyia hominivorax]
MKLFDLKLYLLTWVCIIFIKPEETSASMAEFVTVALAAKDIIDLVYDATTSVAEIWKVAQNFSQDSNDMALILSRLDGISKEIKLIEERNSEPVHLNNMRLLAKQYDISNTMNSIITRFEEFQEYVKHRDNVENATLLKFAEWTASPNSFSVNHLMGRLHLTMFGTDDAVKRPGTNVFETMISSYGQEDKCLSQQSTQQFIYSLYTDIALTEFKAYTMLEFSWMILRAYGKGNFTQEAQIMRNNYEKRTQKTIRLLREVVQKADRQIWRCDPDIHVEGKTFEQVTRLLQGYIENVVDMNTYSSCISLCPTYVRTKNEGCYLNQFCAEQERCQGQIHDCTYAPRSMKICQSPPGNSRRYEYIKSSSVTAGSKTTCARRETEVASWMRYIYSECSYCYCLCDDENSIKTERYFNLRETVCSTNENKVITGLRFVKKYRIFYLQIQEGQLLAKGMINESSLAWTPTDNYLLYEKGVNKNQDYYTLTYDNRAIDLHDIEADDKDYVLTGVRFRAVEGHLNLQARLSKFDFKSGRLLNPQENSYWKSNLVRANERAQLLLDDVDIPIRSQTKSRPDSSDNQYLKFSPTSYKEDVGQTTVPFIDIQDVVSIPAVPLSGIGLYHKGKMGYGGFIAPKIMTYDFAPHIHITTKN